MKSFQGLILAAALMWAPLAYPQERITLPPAFCNTDGSDSSSDTQVMVMNADQATEALVSKIVGFAGLKQNFTITAFDRFNAQAAIYNRKRVIFYNPEFLRSANESANTTWAATGILAHEIAHHLLGHEVENYDTNPKLELEADEYAGFILGKMGAQLNEAKAGFDVVSKEVVPPNNKYPRKSLRLAAVERGWTKAKNLPDPGKVSPVVPENLLNPLKQVLAGTRDRFSGIRGKRLVSQSTYPLYESTLIPPPFQNWQIFINDIGGNWFWIARGPANPDKQQAEANYSAIHSTAASLLSSGWILITVEEGRDGKRRVWNEVGTGALISVYMGENGALSMEVRARRISSTPDEQEYRTRFKALVDAARRGFRGITETRLKDPNSGLLPPDAFTEFVRDISMYKSEGGSTSIHWSTDHERPLLAKARYDMIVRAITELFPSFTEKESDRDDQRRFRDGRVEIQVKLANIDQSGWVTVTIWDWGRE